LRSTSRWELATRPDIAIGQLWSAARAERSIGKTIALVRPHIVHTNSMKAHLLAAIPARIRGIPLVWHVRDILQPGWLRNAFAFLAWRGPIRIACISEAVKSQFAGSHAEEKAVVIYNGIDLSRFDADLAGRKQWRSKLGAKSESSPLAGIVGQLAEWKGQMTFIEAASIVSERLPEARFVIVGECLFPENEAAYEESIHQRATELGLDTKLVWNGWSDYPESVMSALDVLVHASLLPEPFGRVIVEGMASGAAVIASSEGAGPEIIKSDEGTVFQAGDAKALAEAMLGYLRDADRRITVARKAKDGAKRFSIEKTAAAVVALYDELL
jgi:glycosyltransferase involved in cell wall biosynthesis